MLCQVIADYDGAYWYGSWHGMESGILFNVVVVVVVVIHAHTVIIIICRLLPFMCYNHKLLLYMYVTCVPCGKWVLLFVIVVSVAVNLMKNDHHHHQWFWIRNEVIISGMTEREREWCMSWCIVEGKTEKSTNQKLSNLKKKWTGVKQHEYFTQKKFWAQKNCDMHTHTT